jgi:hypothetical protein
MMLTIDESMTAKGFTPAAQVAAAFGFPRTIEEIIIHHWGERGQTHDGVCNFFCYGPGATPAHFVASAGRVNCLVAMRDAAWHCPGQNHRTVGIECRPEATDGDYQTVAELIAWIREAVGKDLPLSMHRDHYPTACPGVWDLARLDKMARAIQSGIGTTPTTPTTKGLFVALAQADENLILDRNKKYVDSPISQVDEKVWGTVIKRSSGNTSALQELADCKTLLLAQGATLAGLLNAISQLSKNQTTPVDLEAVKAAAEAGANSALADLNAVVTFEKGGLPVG